MYLCTINLNIALSTQINYSWLWHYLHQQYAGKMTGRPATELRSLLAVAKTPPAAADAALQIALVAAGTADAAAPALADAVPRQAPTSSSSS
jgi:hypothetical protein